MHIETTSFYQHNCPEPDRVVRDRFLTLIDTRMARSRQDAESPQRLQLILDRLYELQEAHGDQVRVRWLKNKRGGGRTLLDLQASS